MKSEHFSYSPNCSESRSKSDHTVRCGSTQLNKAVLLQDTFGNCSERSCQIDMRSYQSKIHDCHPSVSGKNRPRYVAENRDFESIRFFGKIAILDSIRLIEPSLVQSLIDRLPFSYGGCIVFYRPIHSYIISVVVKCQLTKISYFYSGKGI